MKSKLIAGIMLTLLLLSMLMFPYVIQPVEAQPSGPPTEWTRTYGGVDYDTARSVVEISDGGYAIAGYTRSFGAGWNDCWLVKTDADGNHVWNRTYGGAGFDDGTSVVELDDGGYAIAGYTSSYGVGNDDFWLVRTDSAGNVMWNRTYGGAGIDVAASMVETGDGGYALAGFTYSFGAGWNDFWLVKTDADGNHVWNRTYGGADYEWAYSVVQTSDGGFALAGYTSSLGVGGDIWLVRTDSAGNMLWNQTYGGAGYDEAFSVVQTFDGGYAVAGSTESFGAGGADCWLVKTDADGSHVWNRTYGGAGYDLARSMVQTSEGGYVLAGRTNSSGAGNDDFWLVKVDSSGNHEWSKTYGGSELDWATSVIQTSDGGYALAGRTNSSGAGNDDFWLVKVARAPRIYVDPLISYAGVGETYTIDVSVADVTNLYGFEFKLGYNRTLLDAIDVVFQPFLNEPTYVLRNEMNDESGFVWVAVTSQYPAEPTSGSGTLATIFFQVVGSGECALDLYDAKLSDPDGFPIGHSVGDGFYEGGMTQVVSAESIGNSEYPSLGVSSDGAVHVAWHDDTSLDPDPDVDVFYKRYVPNTGWTQTEVVSTESTGNSLVPSLAVGPDGAVHVAWYDITNYGGSGPDWDIFYKRCVPETGWTTTEVVSTESTGLSMYPSLGVSSNGTVHVAWHDSTQEVNGQDSGTDVDVFYKRYVPNTGWTQTEVVSTESTGNSPHPSLGVSSNGTVHVAWYDATNYGGSGPDWDVFYKRRVPDTGWIATEVVSTESTGTSMYPSLGVSSEGSIHIAWEDHTNYSACGTDVDIFYKRYEAGAHDWNWTYTQVVSTESTEDSHRPSLAVDLARNVHLTWHDETDYADCGSDTDVFYKYLRLHFTEHPWSMFRHNLRHTGYTRSPAPNTNQTQWTYQTGRFVTSSPAVVGGVVFVGSYDDKVYALDQHTGAHIWNYTTGSDVFSSPAVADGKVYVGSRDGKVYCLDASTGAHIWNYTTGDWVYSSPAVADGKVYIGSWDGKVYCLDAITGAHIWNHTSGGDVRSSPAVADGKVYVGSNDGKVYCLDASTGAHMWSYTTGGLVVSSPAVVGGVVFVGSGGGKVYALDQHTGEHVWNFTTGGAVVSSPAVADGKVYVGSNDGKVYCLNASVASMTPDEREIWNYTTGGWVESSPVVADGKVYVGSYDGKVYCLNASVASMTPDEREIWNYTTGSYVYSPAVADAMLFVGSHDHVVYAFGNIIRVPEDYPTIQTAIDAADPGDTISIAAGTYYGSSPVAVINKTLTLLGRSGSSTTFAGGGSGIAVNITDTSYVTITNIDITYWDQGIYIDNSSDCQIYNNVMYLMGDSGVVVDGENAANNQIYNNVFQDNNVAIDVSESSTGNIIYGNTISQNSIGINVVASGGNTIYCNSFINNGQQVNISSQPNAWDYGSLGNYWSNYTGTDANGDGIGDTPHVIDDYNRDNFPLMSPYDYWSNAMLGDVNLDAIVNDEDLFWLAEAYGSVPGAPNWNPYCDLNNDNKIAVIDLFNLSKKYGETAP